MTQDAGGSGVPVAPARRAGSGRHAVAKVLLLSAGLIALSAALLASVAGELTTRGSLPWPLLVGMFVVAELVVLHIQVQREAQTVSLSEVPLVVALFFAGPVELVVTRLVAALVVLLVHRRSSPLKTLFNCSLVLAESSLAIAVFASLSGGGSGSPMQPSAYAGAFAAVVGATVLSVVALALVIGVYEGRASLRQVAAELAGGLPVPLMMCTLTLVGVTSLRFDLRSGWLLAAAAVVLVLCYRAYARLWDRHLSLERLYQFSQVVGSSPEMEEVLRTVLVQARDLLRSESARVVFMPSSSKASSVVVTLAANGRFTRTEEAAPPRAWPRDAVVDRGEPVLLPRGTADPQMRAWLDAHALREAVIVPLRGEAGVVAMLSVGDRLGEVRAFDADDVLLLETVANHASMALQNGRLIDQLRHEALHDALTGLPNRVALQRRMAQVLAELPDGRRAAVMVLDLDGFKEVNDSLGHGQGDRLLVEVGTRLVHAAADDGMVARLGGDEFAVVVPEPGSDAEVLELGRRLLAALEMPIALEGMEVEVGGSLGVAIAPDHATEPGALLKNADMAMYLAKSSSLGVRMFEPELSQASTRRLVMVAELRHAVQNEDLQVHVQPKARLSDGTVTSVEALVRWQHPELGMVSPAEFIPVAERSGLIHGLTQLVLERALTACAQWRSYGWDVGIAVNLSTRSLLDADITAQVRRALARHGLPGHLLTLEITESSAMVEPARAEVLLGQLRDLGVRLSVDDFGTGYSSLSYLKRLPVCEVKIDQSFVRSLSSTGEDDAIVHSIVDLGQHLGLDVVAEGIEDEATWHRLQEMGCAQGQGFVLARPMPVPDFALWYARRTGRPVPELPPAPDGLLVSGPAVPAAQNGQAAPAGSSPAVGVAST